MPTLNHLHPAITDLFWLCFVTGHLHPGSRPTPGQWRSALLEAENALEQCEKGHYFSSHLGNCPTCPPPSRVVRPAPAPAAAAARPDAAPGSSVETQRIPVPTFRARSPAATTSSPKPPAPTSSSPSARGRPAPFARPGSVPARRPMSHIGTWPRQAPSTNPVPAPAVARPGSSGSLGARLLKSLYIGSAAGAVMGTLPGALLGVSSWPSGQIAAWYLLWVLGGAAAGIWRGWVPSYRVGEWFEKHLGWERFWVIAGSINGAILGWMFGMLFWWAIFPVFFGLFAGMRLGGILGRKIWQAGSTYGWARIGGLLGSIGTAVLGGLLAGAAGNSPFGAWANQSIQELGSLLAAQGVSWLITGTLMGALGGAFGGAVAGFCSDFLARLVGLVD